MGAIHVHEFMSLDGVIDAPTWTFDYGFDPKMGEVLAAVTGRCRGMPDTTQVPLGQRTGQLDTSAAPSPSARASSARDRTPSFR